MRPPLMPVSWRKPVARISRSERNAQLSKRDAWLRQIDPTSLFHRLFDVIPGVYFFAKNRQGELMFTCHASRKLYQIPDDAAVVGLTDFDLNPSDMAQTYVKDDARIYATGRPLLNRVELWFDAEGIPDWFVVNKMPIRSRTGKVIGIMGFSQNYEGRARLLQPFRLISNAVMHIRQHYHQPIVLRDLAKISGLSPRQIERKFKATFGVGPRQFLIKTRLLAACRELQESDRTLAEIALTCGFTDQSAFARDFRRHFSVTPTEFRRQQSLNENSRPAIPFRKSKVANISRGAQRASNRVRNRKRSGLK